MGDPLLGGSKDGQGRLPAGNHIKQFWQDKVDVGGQKVQVGGRACAKAQR